MMVRILGIALISFVWEWPQAPQTTKAPGRAPAGIACWDTAQPARQTLARSALVAKKGWQALPQAKTMESFAGDAVIQNGRVAVVARQHGEAIEVYGMYAGSNSDPARLRLLAPDGEPAARVENIALVENAKGGASLAVAYKTQKGLALNAKFRIKRGDVIVETEPGSGAGRLSVEAPSRFVVLPDFFADDIVIDARKIVPTGIDVASDNFILNLRGQGDGLVLSIFESRQQDARLRIGGANEIRTVNSSEIDFEGKKIWVTVLDRPGLWHAAEVKPEDSGVVTKLDWKTPFPAQWRVDFSRPDDLIDSWEMLLQEKNGKYLKPSWLGNGEEHLGKNRRQWNTVLGSYPYPCWSDGTGQGYLQPLKNDALRFQGTVLFYPINRVKETPLDAYTVVDVMRSTLGVGPCEHILDLEGQRSDYKGEATCAVRSGLVAIYSKHEQKLKHDEVLRWLDNGLIFVTHIRSRITRYIEFGHKMRDYLATQKKTHPEFNQFLDEMDKLTQEIDERVDRRIDKIQTPAHVARMNEEFRKNVLDYDGPNALDRCKEYTEALVTIGDNQDELSGECRWVVKTLRQRAGQRLACEPRLAPIVAEIRARTQEAMRNPAQHEGSRH
jgi:hypothetical protein